MIKHTNSMTSTATGTTFPWSHLGSLLPFPTPENDRLTSTVTQRPSSATNTTYAFRASAKERKRMLETASSVLRQYQRWFRLTARRQRPVSWRVKARARKRRVGWRASKPMVVSLGEDLSAGNVSTEGRIRGWSSEMVSIEGLPASSGTRWYFPLDAILSLSLLLFLELCFVFFGWRADSCSLQFGIPIIALRPSPACLILGAEHCSLGGAAKPTFDLLQPTVGMDSSSMRLLCKSWRSAKMVEVQKTDA